MSEFLDKAPPSGDYIELEYRTRSKKWHVNLMSGNRQPWMTSENYGRETGSRAGAVRSARKFQQRFVEVNTGRPLPIVDRGAGS